MRGSVQDFKHILGWVIPLKGIKEYYVIYPYYTPYK